MRVYFDGTDFSSTSGPNSFVRRLAKQLSMMGVDIADHDDYDIALVTIEATPRLDRRKPFVLRLDGIWFRPDEFATRNVGIRSSYDHADSVVFQSDFDSRMVTKWFGPCKRPNVITNGIELERVSKFGDAVLKLRDTYKWIYVCSSSWHPQKRLSENVKLYRHLRASISDPSCLIIMGGGQVSMDRNCMRDDIFYTGPQDQDTCLQVFAASDVMLHLAWLDHCPNVVLESLSQETPVVCTSSGGTSEILGGRKENGWIIPDAPYSYELMDYDRPPQVPDFDVQGLLDSVIEHRNKGVKPDIGHLDISLCAERYLRVFEEVLVPSVSLEG